MTTGSQRDTAPVPPAAPQPATDEEVARLTLLGMGYHFDRSLGEWVKSDGAAPQTPAEPTVSANEIAAVLKIMGNDLPLETAVEVVFAVKAASPHSAGPAPGSVVVEAASNAVPSTLSVPRSSPK